MKILSFSALLIAFISACNSKGPSHKAVDNTPFEAGVVTGIITEELLEEASGIVPSIKNSNYLWTHNDSGDDARLFLIDKTGKRIATVNLAGANNRDWEDIAIGQGPNGKTYLYIADIGDNEAENKYKYIYRVEEPLLDLTKTTDTTLSNIEKITFEYPDGVRDAESMMIDPITQDLFVISKRELKCNVYRLASPQPINQPILAELVIERIEFEKTINGDTIRNGDEILIKGYHPKYYYQIVGADVSLKGDEVLVKSYSSVYYWKRKPKETITELLKREPILLNYNPEPQGEAISFDITGNGFYTINERMKGKEQKLIYYKRK